jgi:hypothetical protein
VLCVIPFRRFFDLYILSAVFLFWSLDRFLVNLKLKSKLKIIHLVGVFIFSLGGFYQRLFKIVRGCYGNNLEVLNTSS